MATRSVTGIATGIAAGRTAVACAQIDLGGDTLGRGTHTDSIAQAAADGADIVVLPELASTGYMFDTEDELRSLAESSTGQTITGWCRIAHDLNIVLVAGFAELGDDNKIYNSAVILDQTGVLGIYRKVHLWDNERELFSPGTASPLVVSTKFGKLGVMICYDLEFPEWSRDAALQGAALICAPTNWPLEEVSDDPMERIKVRANASVNRMAFAVCDRVGRERGTDWVGGSCIVDQSGNIVAAAPLGTSDLVLGSVDISASTNKRISARNDVLMDRTPEHYRRLIAPTSVTPSSVTPSSVTSSSVTPTSVTD